MRSDPASPPAPGAAVLPPLPSPARLQQLLFDAARLGRIDVLPALLEAGVDIEARDDKGHTPLILASYNGHAAATEALIKAGARVDAPDSARGNTALMGVVFKGYEAFVDRLLIAGADPERANHAGQTALMMAAMFGRTAIIDRLLAAGADPLRVDAVGNSAWSVARGQGNEVIVQRLMAGRRARQSRH
ncbi:ankyrin repeat domain-containing protein [Sphingomonas crocodyli]|uniref:Ankyrin repeat domain-containing protein n=1 Tax=Sphingomonas crocodyli TaxID=1979270 RepID=A0A437LYQ4_9SPHN|nr:ankyrin repeat domain-containing protein [Sphingomonas crocodyli]RVT90559.1 ankyrin repeat domain-containing protein [Sphingomonas crocodyli]